MINGDVNEFVDGLYYGDERAFVYKGQKFFIQGWLEGKEYKLLLDRWEPPADDYVWIGSGLDRATRVKDFLNAPIWDGRTFREAEGEMEWVD